MVDRVLAPNSKKPMERSDRARGPGFGVERVAVGASERISKKFRDHRVARIFRGRAELPPQNRSAWHCRRADIDLLRGTFFAGRRRRKIDQHG